MRRRRDEVLTEDERRLANRRHQATWRAKHPETERWRQRVKRAKNKLRRAWGLYTPARKPQPTPDGAA
jgi:hypothetical protein